MPQFHRARRSPRATPAFFRNRQIQLRLLWLLPILYITLGLPPASAETFQFAAAREITPFTGNNLSSAQITRIGGLFQTRTPFGEDYFSQFGLHQIILRQGSGQAEEIREYELQATWQYAGAFNETGRILWPEEWPIFSVGSGVTQAWIGAADGAFTSHRDVLQIIDQSTTGFNRFEIPLPDANPIWSDVRKVELWFNVRAVSDGTGLSFGFCAGDTSGQYFNGFRLGFRPRDSASAYLAAIKTTETGLNADASSASGIQNIASVSLNTWHHLEIRDSWFSPANVVYLDGSYLGDWYPTPAKRLNEYDRFVFISGTKGKSEVLIDAIDFDSAEGYFRNRNTYREIYADLSESLPVGDYTWQVEMSSVRGVVQKYVSQEYSFHVIAPAASPPQEPPPDTRFLSETAVLILLLAVLAVTAGIAIGVARSRKK